MFYFLKGGKWKVFLLDLFCRRAWSYLCQPCLVLARLWEGWSFKARCPKRNTFQGKSITANYIDCGKRFVTHELELPRTNGKYHTMQVATAYEIRFLAHWNFKVIIINMLRTQPKVMHQYLYRCDTWSIKTTICYRCFLKGFQSRKDFWAIVNDVWTNYSAVCTPMRHNLEQSQTYSRTSSSMWNLNELLHFSFMWVGGRRLTTVLLTKKNAACPLICGRLE